MKNKTKSEQIIDFIKNNQTTVFTTIGFTIIIILLIIFIYTRIQVVNANSSDKMTMALQYFAQTQVEEGVKMLDDIINNYSSTPSAYRAMLTKANYLYGKKEYEQAKELTLNVIHNAKPETVKPLAYPLLIAIFDNMENTEQAIETSKMFTEKYKEHFLVPSVMENLARLYEVSGNTEEAKKTYTQIETLFPNTVYAQRAKDKNN
jgi:predicted negative regulator of RcsB-dependent stress response